MRVLVCGGRNYDNWSDLKNTLDDIHINWVDLSSVDDPEFILIEGGAIGADFLSKVWLKDLFPETWKDHLLEFPADWKRYGKAAGSIRNQQMIDEGQPDLVVAFPGGNGTADMINKAEKVNIPVVVVE